MIDRIIFQSSAGLEWFESID